MDYKGLTLDQFQIDSIDAVKRNNSVVVSAPTGSGKTLIAEYIIERNLKAGKRVIYTAPIKALSNQKFKDFCRDYGEDKIGIMTGDVVINPMAPILIMTTEVYRNMVLVGDESVKDVGYVVFDEIHFINDIERGYVWEESIIFSPSNVRFLCLSATIPNAKEFAQWIKTIKKHEVEVIINTKRSVPLQTSFYCEEGGITSLEHIRDLKNIPRYRSKGKGKENRALPPRPDHVHLVKLLGKEKSPILFFCFSRAACQRNASELTKAFNPPFKSEIVTFIRQKLSEAPPEAAQLVSMRVLRETLPRGVGFHHAGLLPFQKEMVEELFGKGLLDVLYTTETFAVGINMPAKTVCFESLRKFNGIGFADLTSKEFFQMAGRAGRRGMDKVGFVVPMIDLLHFKYDAVKEMTSVDKEPLSSQFRLSVNTVLNLVDHHTPEEREAILEKSLYSYQKGSRVIRKNYRSMIAKLVKREYIVNDQLSVKGFFAAKIFCDEVKFAEMFATDFWRTLTDYEISLIIGAMVFEGRRNTRFFNERKTKVEKDLMDKTRQIIGLRTVPKIVNMSAIIYPLFQSKDFFTIVQNTTMDEGDLLRLLSQFIDRTEQLIRATNDFELRERLKNTQNMVRDVIKVVGQ